MVLTITVKHIWIIKDDGLSLTEFNLSNNQYRRVHESVFGTFTASLVKIIMATGLDEEGNYTIVLEKRSLYYHYSYGIVICLQIDKKENKKK